MAIRVLIVEGHTLTCRAWQQALEANGSLQVQAVAASAEEALAQVARAAPELAVVELGRPGHGGARLIRALRERCPGLRALAVVQDPSPERVQQAVAAGAAGCLLRGAGPAELVRALEALLDGARYFSQALHAALYEVYVAAVRGAPGDAVALSEAERRVVAGVAKGLSNGEIAARLGLGLRSVERHRAHAMRALGARSSAELVRLALGHGLLGVES
jgi:DNA-binding NarL/FixJ family response regulator